MASRHRKIDAQVLNLGFEEVMSQEEGKTMVETAVSAIPFQSSRLKPRLEKLDKERFTRRLWEKDASLWKTDPDAQRQISESLGFLDVAERMEEKVGDLKRFAGEVRAAGFTHVVHMGMGGSSLAPLALQHILQTDSAGLPLTVLDTTDPFTIATLEQELEIERSLFIVASKSGTTAEPLAFDNYFYERVKSVKGQKAGENFIAITDPGTPLVTSAHERRFRRVFLNFSDIGGRYSALSYFGLVPAALMGVDVEKLLGSAVRMQRACSAAVTASRNPGVMLGAAIGEMVGLGRDKVTFLLPRNLVTLGMWLEQLIAESTGKEGIGVLPVTGEPIGNPAVYGEDRLFVYMYVKGQIDEELEKGLNLLQGARLPVVLIELEQAYDIGQEFFRWEIATATVGAMLGINSFDQPNVQESKEATNRLLKLVEERGSLTEPAPVLTDGPLSFFYKESAETPEQLMWALLSQGRPGDYVSLQAYLTEDPAVDVMLQVIRTRMRDGLRLATTLGYGPRFLHSTGQFHKGGPNTGLFIQLTQKDKLDISIPGRSYGFRTLKKAQALGDLEALEKHGRRVMRVDLGDDARKGLTLFQKVLGRAVPTAARR